LFIPNSECSPMKKLAEKHNTKLFYVLADPDFVIQQ